MAWYMYQHPACAARSNISSSSFMGWETHFFFSGAISLKSAFSQSSSCASELSTMNRRLLSMLSISSHHLVERAGPEGASS